MCFYNDYEACTYVYSYIMYMYVVIYCADDSEELRPCQQLNRKSVASAFWKYQIEDELNVMELTLVTTK